MSNEIFKRIEVDRLSFQKNKDILALGTCKVILGEIHRDPDKDRSDTNVILILKSLRKMTLKSPISDPLLIDMVDSYIPAPVSDMTVIKWVKSMYSYQDIVSMGSKAYSIIGQTKRHYGDIDINSSCVKKLIDDTLKDGKVAYNTADDIPDIDIDLGDGVFMDLFEDLMPPTFLPDTENDK